MLNTKIGENYNANDVMNPNDLRKRILNVDSRFRSDQSQPTTNYTLKLDHTYKNLIRLRIASVEVPNMIYTFTEKNNSFTVKAYDYVNILRMAEIKIPVGNYTSDGLMVTIQNLFIAKMQPYGIYLNITVDSTSAKVTITNTGVSIPASSPPGPTNSAKPFAIIFGGMGKNLGFLKSNYKVNNIGTGLTVGTPPTSIDTYYQTGESCLDVVGDTYMFLCVNDLYTVDQTTNDNYIQCLAKIIIRESRYDVIYDDGSSYLSNEIIFPAPTDLKILQVKLIDAYGEVVDLNNMNFSFSLEITEVLNTAMYDFYRNYIWLGTIPSIKKPSGSQIPLGMGPPF